MKKGCLIALGVLAGLVLLAAIGIFFIFRMTAPLADAGEKFVSTFGAGRHAEAYAMTSAALRAEKSEADFTQKVSALGLSSYQSVSWSNRSINNDTGKLEGTVTTATGGKIPLEMNFVYEGGTWKLTQIAGNAVGVKDLSSSAETPAAVSSKAKVPDNEEAAQMAEEALLKFNEAVSEKSFTEFHGNLAKPFRQQFSPEKLAETFQAFIEQGIDLRGIKDVEPVFDTPPAVNGDGLLVLKGHYPTKPSRVIFDLKYLPEGSEWKVAGINVNVKPEQE